MAYTFLEMQNVILDLMEQDDSITRDRVKRYINMVGSDIWLRYPWPERRKTYFSQTVPVVISPGTVTVTQGSTTVTGVGTQWIADGNVTPGMKFSLGNASPWYVINAVLTDTQLELENPYVEGDLSGSLFFIYQDVITLPQDCEKIVNLMTADPDRGGVAMPIARIDLDALVYLPRSQGVPTQYAMMELTDGGSQTMRVWPVPDIAYGYQITYLNKWVDLVDDTDVPQLEEDKRDIMTIGALKWGYLQAFEAGKAQLAEARYERDLARAIGIASRRHPMRLVMRKFDDWSVWRNPLQMPFKDAIGN